MRMRLIASAAARRENAPSAGFRALLLTASFNHASCTSAVACKVWSRRLARHLRGRQLAQFLIDQRQQFLGGFWVALVN